MSWFQILKIKTPEGNPLRMIDYDQFITKLKAMVNSKVLQYRPQDYYPGTRRPKPNPRKSNVNINRKRGVTKGRELTFSVSGLNPTSGERYRYDFVCWEDKTGDYVYVSVVGPGINFHEDTVLNNEDEIIMHVAEVIGKMHARVDRPKVDVRETIDTMREEHGERDSDITAFGRKEQKERDEAREKDDPSLTPEARSPNKGWRERFRRWRGRR